MNRYPAILILGFATPCVTLHAVEWLDRVQEVRVAPLQSEVEVAFRFVNDGSRPLSIADLRTNCDCLEARADRKSYGPGERGAITAIFTVGDRLGIHERAVTVVTSEGGEPVRLAVRVDVPPAAGIEPRSIEWARESPPDPRSADLRVAPELSIEFTDAVVTSDDFVARLEPVEPGRRYRLVVAPRATSSPTSAAIRLRGRERSGRPITVSAYAYVR